MTNNVTTQNTNFQLPAHLQGFGDLATDINSGITGGIKAGGHPRIGIKASRWRIEENGVEEVHPSLTLNVIIVSANKTMSKVFYAGKYNPQATEFKAPDCFSDNGVGPSTSASSPQHSNCAACPNNVWGSKINELGNKTKACADYKKVAVVLADDPERNVYELRIPGASLQDFNKVMTRCVNNKLPIPAIVFELSFDADVQFPKVNFKPIGYVQPDQKEAVLAWMNSQEAKDAVGANDQATAQTQLGTMQQPPVYQQSPVQPNATYAPPVQTQYVPQQPVQQTQARPQPAQDPFAALNAGGQQQAAEAPKRRGRPTKAAQEPHQAAHGINQGIPAQAPTGQMAFDIPGMQAASQATPIAPQQTNADLDKLLEGVFAPKTVG